MHENLRAESAPQSTQPNSCLRTGNLDEFMDKKQTFMLPGRIALAALGVLVAYIAIALLAVPLGLAAIVADFLWIGNADLRYRAVNFVIGFTLPPLCLYLLYCAFERFNWSYLLLSFASAFASMLFLHDIFLRSNRYSTDELGEKVLGFNPENITHLFFYNYWILLVLFYIVIFFWYLVMFKNLKTNHLLRPLIYSRSRSPSGVFSRYGVLTSRQVWLNAGSAFVRSLAIYLKTLLLAFPLLLFAPSWLAIPTVFGLYSAHRFRTLFDEFRQRSALSAASLYDSDQRPRVLYLRSFGVDKLYLRSKMILPHWAVNRRWSLLPLEQVLVDIAFRYGPVGALQDPNVQLAPLGAARDITQNSRWQDYISSHMKLSHDVICVLGETDGLEWEIRTAISEGIINKFIFLFPPNWKIHADNQRFYNDIFEMIGVSPEFSNPPLVLYYLQDGSMVLLTSRRQSIEDYRNGLTAAFESRRSA